jgi:threonine synthase
MTKLLRCTACKHTFDLLPLFNACPVCGCALEVDYDYDALATRINEQWWRHGDGSQGIWRHAELLPANATAAISLGEGNTPLVKSRNIGPRYGLNNLFYKNETVNPTWSQKDRCQSVMITKAREFGFHRVVTTSTGNHGASAAAYSAAAGMDACEVYCPPDTSNLLLRFINSFGGTAIVKDWDARAGLMLHRVSTGEWYPATSLGAGPATNPFGIEGYKTIAYEIVTQLGYVPDRVVMSVASGNSLYGVWKGFWEMRRLGRIDRLPRMWCAQPSGADVVARSLAEGRDTPITLTAPHSVAVSIREPTTGVQVLNAIRDSDGGATPVDDDAILQATQLIGRDGLCCEPASAASLAAVLKLEVMGQIQPDERIVCVITSAGIKWPDSLAAITPSTHFDVNLNSK